jgi:Tfp pilus assembly protein PilN
LRVLVFQIDSSVRACTVEVTQKAFRSREVWRGSFHTSKLGRLWEAEEELSSLLREAVRELRVNPRTPAVVVLPPESCAVSVLPPGPRGPRQAEEAVRQEASRMRAVMGGEVTHGWKRTADGRVVAYFAALQAVDAVHLAAAAHGMRKLRVVPVQEAVAACNVLWSGGADGRVIVDCLDDSWCTYFISGGVVAGWERVPRREQEALPVVIRRVSMVHGGASAIGLAGHAAEGGMAVLLRGALGLDVELVSFPGGPHDLALAVAAAGAWRERGLVRRTSDVCWLVRTVRPAERRSIAVPAAALVASLVFGGYWSVQERRMSAELVELRRRRAELAVAAAQARLEAQRLSRMVAEMQQASRNAAWGELMQSVRVSTPLGVQLKSVEGGPSGGRITGIARSFEDVFEMARRLEMQRRARNVRVVSVKGSSAGTVEFALAADISIPGLKESARRPGQRERPERVRRGLTP